MMGTMKHTDDPRLRPPTLALAFGAAVLLWVAFYGCITNAEVLVGWAAEVVR